MGISTHPKVFAKSIAEGYLPFTQATVKQFTAAELKTISGALELVAREYRGLSIPLGEIKALQRRNQCVQRANTALMLIRSHAKRRRIPL